MTALRPKIQPDDMVVVRVPMSQRIYRRLLAEALLLDREPAALARDILVTAFNSGDLTELRDISPLVSEACGESRGCAFQEVSAVASASKSKAKKT